MPIFIDKVSVTYLENSFYGGQFSMGFSMSSNASMIENISVNAPRGCVFFNLTFCNLVEIKKIEQFQFCSKNSLKMPTNSSICLYSVIEGHILYICKINTYFHFIFILNQFFVFA